MKWPEFADVARFILALMVVGGGGFMVYAGRAAPETIYPIIGVVLGFYFGAANTSTVTKAATTAATEAVSRSLEERGIK